MRLVLKGILNKLNAPCSVNAGVGGDYTGLRQCDDEVSLENRGPDSRLAPELFALGVALREI